MLADFISGKSMRFSYGLCQVWDEVLSIHGCLPQLAVWGVLTRIVRAPWRYTGDRLRYVNYVSQLANVNVSQLANVIAS